ncbi:Longitudinals lacking protein, isoforms F/I/K/T [Anthophora retusa]
MVMSQNAELAQDNNDGALWSQFPYPDTIYKMNKSRRSSETKSACSNYVCSRCGKTYKATTSLSRHKRLECGVVPTEVCPICDRRFKHRFVLKSHVVGCQRKLRHMIQKNTDTSASLTSLVASTGFPSKSAWNTLDDYRNAITMDDHQLLKERNFNEVYYYQYDPNKKQQLLQQQQQQQQQHHQPQQQQSQLFTCALCGKEYSWMYSLRRHQLQCGNKEARNKCHFCFRKFYRRDRLKEHLLAHHPELI